MSEENTENISAVILAGGKSKRFNGLIKSNIIIGGATILDRIIQTISGIFTEIIIVTSTPEKFNINSSFLITSDFYHDKGPLAGIHAGMKVSKNDAVFVFAGDMPFIDKDIIRRQISEFKKLRPEILVPEINGQYEPLHAVYSGLLSGRLEEFLNSPDRRAVQDFFDYADVALLKLPDSEKTKRAFTNINTPSEASEAEKKADLNHFF